MATTHDHSALIRNIQLATGVTTVAATGLLAASAHMLFRFAIDTQWKHSIFHQALIAPDREGKMNQGEAKEAEQWFSETKQPVSITSRDGLKLALRSGLHRPDAAYICHLRAWLYRSP